MSGTEKGASGACTRLSTKIMGCMARALIALHASWGSPPWSSLNQRGGKGTGLACATFATKAMVIPAGMDGAKITEESWCGGKGGNEGRAHRNTIGKMTINAGLPWRERRRRRNRHRTTIAALGMKNVGNARCISARSRRALEEEVLDAGIILLGLEEAIGLENFREYCGYRA